MQRMFFLCKQMIDNVKIKFSSYYFNQEDMSTSEDPVWENSWTKCQHLDCVHQRK